MAKLTGFTVKKIHRRPGQKRIILPQSKYRPLKLTKRDAVKREFFAEDDRWFVQHKRGVRRPLVGEDPLEARAVSEIQVPGFLHERIVYKKLTDRRLVPGGVDFSFQSSFDGGRNVLGGIVVDFLFFSRRIVIRVQGPQHNENLQRQKDDQQQALLAEMGYTTLDLDIETIADANQLEAWMRKYIDNAMAHGLDHAGYGGDGYIFHNDIGQFWDSIQGEEHLELMEIALRTEARLAAGLT